MVLLCECKSFVIELLVPNSQIMSGCIYFGAILYNWGRAKIAKLVRSEILSTHKNSVLQRYRLYRKHWRSWRVILDSALCYVQARKKCYHSKYSIRAKRYSSLKHFMFTAFSLRVVDYKILASPIFHHVMTTPIFHKHEPMVQTFYHK